MQQIVERQGSSIIFILDVEVPAHQAAAFEAAMTGNDDDIFLAAETAMRERVGRSYDVELEELELGVPDEASVKRALHRAGEKHAHSNS
jgi:hypothetical protein